MIERYSDQRITAIFSPEAMIARWVEVELAAMDALGHDPGPVVPPSPQAVTDEESVTKHDVVAFLRAWCKSNPDNATLHRWVHYGLTSSNVVDCGLMLAVQDATAVIRTELNDLTWATHRVEQLLEGTPQVGRTHGRWAIVREASHPWSVLTQGLERAVGRIARASTMYGSLAGPVGESLVLNQHAEIGVLKGLGLKRTASTQVVPRDGLVEWAQQLALLATQCEAVAVQVRLLAQSGIDEVREQQANGQVGSSAMPHKQNPIRSENITGLARLARAQIEPLMMSIVQWGDHDLAHSSVERVVVPDLCHLMCSILARTRLMLDGLRWNKAKIATNIVDAELAGSSSHVNLLDLQKDNHAYLEAHLRLGATSREDTHE